MTDKIELPDVEKMLETYRNLSKQTDEILNRIKNRRQRLKNSVT